MCLTPLADPAFFRALQIFHISYWPSKPLLSVLCCLEIWPNHNDPVRADICHTGHNQRWCAFFTSLSFFAERMQNFGKFWLFGWCEFTHFLVYFYRSKYCGGVSTWKKMRHGLIIEVQSQWISFFFNRDLPHKTLMLYRHWSQHASEQRCRSMLMFWDAASATESPSIYCREDPSVQLTYFDFSWLWSESLVEE